MFPDLPSRLKVLLHKLLSKSLLLLLVALGMLAILACNPFAGGDEEEVTTTNSEELVEVSVDRSPSGLAGGNQRAEASQPDPPPAEEAVESPEEGVVEPAQEPPSPEEDPETTETSAEPLAEEATAAAPLDAGAEAALDLTWAFLSQCISLSINELEARQINGEWYVQAAGESPDRYGVWKVDPASGSVEAHNIRAREWAPQINAACTQESFAQFYVPTPVPQSSTGITEGEQAITSLWATLVKCYPSIQPGDLQATLNPARAEWIVTGKPEVSTNYGVWAVRSNGEVIPHNRQAQGIHDQLDSGLC